MSMVESEPESAAVSARAPHGEARTIALAVSGVFVLGFLALALGQGIAEMLVYGAAMETDRDPRSSAALNYGEAKSMTDLTILALGVAWIAYLGAAVSFASIGPRAFGRTFGMLVLLSVIVIVVPVGWPLLDLAVR